ncbi:MAG: hypothetical protein J5586_01725 [Clostridia bacterium]|nr:hypothetical protein [Clostridia bacterium]
MYESELAAHLVEKVLVDDTFLDRIIRDSNPKNQKARARLVNQLRDTVSRMAKVLSREPSVSGKIYKLQRTIEKAYSAMSQVYLKEHSDCGYSEMEDM